jgi:hypothetical protein
MGSFETRSGFVACLEACERSHSVPLQVSTANNPIGLIARRSMSL